MRKPYDPPKSKKKVVRGVSRSDLIERARGLVPKLRERAQRTEQNRNILDETIRDFHDLGLWRMLQPERWGGFEMDYAIIVDVLSEIGRGCASSAWILGNFASRLWQIGMLPEEAQNEVWGKDTSTLVCSTYVFPSGRVTRTSDGWRVKGVRPWPFASGVDISEWATIGALFYEDDSPNAKPEPIQMLLHKSEYTVSDTWFASGLIGTGSKDLEVGEVTVPWYRGAFIKDFRGGPTPGSKLNPGPLYRLPVFAAFPHIPASPGLGAAQAAFDDVVESTKRRMSSYTGQSMADLTPIQIKIAEAGASLDAARLLLLDNCDEMMAIAEAGGTFELIDRARYRRDGAYAGKLFTHAVDLCVQVTGAAGLYNRNPMQRYFRDVHAVMQHISMVWDVSAQVYGGVAVGVDPLLPTI